MKMFPSLQYNAEICDLRTRIVLPSSSLYSGTAMLAPQQGHQSQGCVVNFNGPFASLLISSFERACHFDVKS